MYLQHHSWCVAWTWIYDLKQLQASSPQKALFRQEIFCFLAVSTFGGLSLSPLSPRQTGGERSHGLVTGVKSPQCWDKPDKHKKLVGEVLQHVMVGLIVCHGGKRELIFASVKQWRVWRFTRKATEISDEWSDIWVPAADVSDGNQYLITAVRTPVKIHRLAWQTPYVLLSSLSTHQW